MPNRIAATFKSQILQHNFLHYGAGIAQSVQRLPTGWTAEGPVFKSRQGQQFSILHVVPTGFGAQSTSCPICTGDTFPGDKAAGA
jgi:hypothetical protein